MAGQTINISVLADTGKARKGFDTLAGRLDSLGSKFSKIGTGFGVVGAAAVAGLAAAIKPASDLQQNIGGVQAVFGKFANSVIKDSNRAASAFGLSANEYDSFATVIGSQLKNAGVPIDQLGSKTKSLVSQASDLAATFGGSTSDAVEALSSAMKGEFDPIEKYGITLNQNAINAQAAAMGFKAVNGQFNQQARVAATLALVNKQGADAQGQFAKQTTTLAEQQQILKAKLANTVANLGTAFLPMVSKVADAALKLVDGPGFKGIVSFLTNNPQLVLGLVGGLLGLAAAFKTAGLVLQSWSTVTKIASAVQAAFNLVLSANPIGIVILAIAALVAGLVYFFTQTKTGQKIVQVAMAGIGTAIKAVTDWFTKTALPAVTGTWKAITGAFSAGASAVGRFMNAAWAVIKTVWNYSPYGVIVNNWGAIVGFFTKIPGRISGAVGNIGSLLAGKGRDAVNGIGNGAAAAWGGVVGWFSGIGRSISGTVGNLGGLLYNAGSRIIGGLLDGIRDQFQNVKNFVSGIAGWIAAHKGPKAYDLGLLVPNGGWIMQGLITGLQKAQPQLRAQLQQIAGTIQGSELGTPGFTPGTLTASAAPAPIQVIVQAGIGNPVEIGREIERALTAWQRANGGRTAA